MIRAMVIGRARGVWEEVAALEAMASFDSTIVVGKAGVDYPQRIDHWVTFHVELLPMWIEQRRAKRYPDAGQYWSAIYQGRPIRGTQEYPPVQRVVCNGGSSGLIGVIVALEAVNADRIALAGIPLDSARGHYDELLDWDEAERYRSAWSDQLHRLRGRVRSMSGWTCELLGGKPPTRAWLMGEE